MRKRVGILGSGKNAQSVANKFLKHGYEVMLGTREKGSLANWVKKTNGNSWIGSFEEAAHFGDFVILVVRDAMAEFTLDMAGAATLHGKTVLFLNEETNEQGGELFVYFLNKSSKLLKKLQDKYSRVHFVKVITPFHSDFEDGLQVNRENMQIKIFGNNDEAKNNARIAMKFLGLGCEDLGNIDSVITKESLFI